MEELLTAREVQEALKVDRTTIYRMLKDGRLTGVKVGNQWRFPVSDLQGLLSGSRNLTGEWGFAQGSILPLWCMQPVQDVFAEMAEIGSIITDVNGIPLTRMSNSCEFCNLILTSEKGVKACQDSWRQLAGQSRIAPDFTACHAGLQYALARITVCGEPIAFLVAGQFYSEESDPTEEEKRVEALALEYQLDPRRLKAAASRIRVLGGRLVSHISHWLSRVAITFEQIGTERADMLARLHHIAEMSTIDLPEDHPTHPSRAG
jgi:excisionase family DNA binding protein